MKVLYWIAAVLVILSVSVAGSLLVNDMLFSIVWGFGVGFFGGKAAVLTYESIWGDLY